MELGAKQVSVLRDGVEVTVPVERLVVGDLFVVRGAVDDGEVATEPSEPSPEGLTTYLERWFAEQGLDRPHVAGNSLGGGLALERRNPSSAPRQARRYKKVSRPQYRGRPPKMAFGMLHLLRS